jgi:hypothetical protein
MEYLKQCLIFSMMVSFIHWGLVSGWKHEGMPAQLHDEDTPSLDQQYRPLIEQTRGLSNKLQEDLDHRMGTSNK